MGCGQSKIGNLYPKNKKNKNGSKRNGFSIRSASIEQKNGNGNNKGNKTNNNGAEVNRNEEQNGSPDKSQAKKKPIVPGGTPLLQQAEISTSQLDFFRMLDEKIENGPDYDESADVPLRCAGFLQRWELASVSWQGVSDMNSNAPTLKHQQQHQQQMQQMQQMQQPHRRGTLPPPISGLGSSGLTAKDREGMRNIIGGRPESAPVFVQRVSSANRLDGIQDHHLQHCPSPSMPRHVLESISQSPTQSLKTPPGLPSPTTVSRYQHHYQQSRPRAGPYLNGEYLYRDQRDYRQQQYESSSPGALLRNSPGNPYVQQFQIQSSPAPPAATAAAARKRPGFNAAQMT